MKRPLSSGSRAAQGPSAGCRFPPLSIHPHSPQLSRRSTPCALRSNVFARALIPVLLFAIPLSAQSPFVWEHFYGSSNNEVAKKCIRTEDGGLLLAGTTDHFARENREPYIIKLDEGGEVEWTQALGQLWWDSYGDIIQTRDGGYLAMGSNTLDRGLEGRLIKLDEDGEVVWERYTETQVSDYFHCGVEFDDGTLAVYAHYSIPGQGQYWEGVAFYNEDGEEIRGIRLLDNNWPVAMLANEDDHPVLLSRTGGQFHLREMNLDGQDLWNADLGDNGFYSITATSDGGYALLGAAGDNPCIAKVSGDGEAEWTRVYDMDARLNAITELDNETLLLAGYGFQFIHVAANGNEISRYDVPADSSTAMYVSSLLPDGDGGCLLFGTSTGRRVGSDTEGRDFRLVRFNRDLEPEDWATYGFPSANYESCRDIVQLEDGSLAVTGITYVTPDMNPNILLLMASADGDSLWSRQYWFGEEPEVPCVLPADGDRKSVV